MTTTPCSWYGVGCYPSNEHVETIEAEGNSMNGVIPPEIGNLPYLQYMTLSGNLITATATDALGNNSEISLPVQFDEQVGHALYLPRIEQHPERFSVR